MIEKGPLSCGGSTGWYIDGILAHGIHAKQCENDSWPLCFCATHASFFCMVAILE